MRRIIERVVTVVTTTTWTISSQDDPLHASRDPQADPVPSAEVQVDAAQTTQHIPPVIETKEADGKKQENVINPMADEPPTQSHSYSTKIERK